MSRNKDKELKLEAAGFERYAKDPRAIWAGVGYAILQRPCAKPMVVDGSNESADERLERLTYEQLKRDINLINDDIEGEREPTELEMIMACQARKARTNTQAAVFIRDTLGAKPVERAESQVVVNDYSRLSDEELEMLVEYRAKSKEGENGEAQLGATVQGEQESDSELGM